MFAMLFVMNSGDALMPETLDPMVLAERERCAALLELTPSQIRLMAGEMSAQEMRTVQAVLANRARAIRSPGSVVSL